MKKIKLLCVLAAATLMASCANGADESPETTSQDETSQTSKTSKSKTQDDTSEGNDSEESSAASYSLRHSLGALEVDWVDEPTEDSAGSVFASVEIVTDQMDGDSIMDSDSETYEATLEACSIDKEELVNYDVEYTRTTKRDGYVAYRPSVSALTDYSSALPSFDDLSKDDIFEGIVASLMPIIDYDDPAYAYHSRAVVTDRFFISGRGTIVTIQMLNGTLFADGELYALHAGVESELSILAMHSRPEGTEVDVEYLNKDSVYIYGDTTSYGVGALWVSGEDIRSQFSAGDIVYGVQASYGAVKEMTVDIHVKTKEEGGRPTPFGDGYGPQLYFGTFADSTVRVTLDGTEAITQGTSSSLDENGEWVLPGNDVTDLKVTFTAETGGFGLQEEDEIVLKEGGRTVATGTVKEILSWYEPA
ncbi:MAG: hypothetical protein IJ247_05625 [Bacilli bacterium]|nr:hypothetical protein [Bacilli bacterium]